MFMQKITAPACNLFDVTKGFEGTGTRDKPREANDSEIRAYAMFLARRATGLAELETPSLEFNVIGSGASAHRYCVGATFGAILSGGKWCREAGHYIPAEYEPGAFSVLFPGANQMRAKVTFETLDESGEVLTSSTMPVEPKKGGIVWGKDEVRKACGPVAKAAKAKRAPTVAKRRAAPTVAEQDKRRRAVMLALKLRAELRRARQVAADRLGHIIDLTSDLHGVGAESGQDCAEAVTPTHVAPMLSDAILSDLAAAERLMSGVDYVAPKPRKARAPGHERAILRAWAMRKARREAQWQAAEWEEAQHRAWSAGMGRKMARRRAVLRAMNLRAMLRDERAMSDARLAEALRNADRARLAEQIAEDHLQMREQMRAALCASERRAEMAEAENAELWAEIETLTAPVPALAA